jgi:hypothetical protein
LVRTAFLADARRLAADRRRAAPLAWFESARRDAALRRSLFNAALAALERRDDGFDRRFAARVADAALRLVRCVALAGGADSFTPALRALDSPIAIACFVDRAPCLPSRTWWISSRTNSPA